MRQQQDNVERGKQSLFLPGEIEALFKSEKIITTVQAMDDSINLNLTKPNFDKAYRILYSHFEAIKSNPVACCELFDIAIDMNMMALASDVRHHMGTHYRVYWKQHLATLTNGK